MTSPVREDTLPNRWLPVVGGVLMNMALGTMYASSAFLPGVEKDFGWTRSQSSIIAAIGYAMIASWFVIGGRLIDKKGPRPVSMLAVIFFTLGFIVASQTHSLSTWYLGWALIGMGNGFGYVVPSVVCSKWFPDKRGFIIGLVVAGYGAGSGIFGPLANTLIHQIGWRATLQWYAAIFFVMTTVAAYLLRNPPEGYKPPGWDPSQVRTVAPRGGDVMASQMLKTRTFYALWIAYAFGTTAGVMVISQLAPFAKEAGQTALAASLAFPVGAFGNAGGRFLSGWSSDHIGRLNTLRIVVLISAIAMPALYMFRANPILFFGLLFVVYYCYGTQLSVYASTSADFYGTRNFGFNYGLLLLAWGVGGGFAGGLIAGKVHDATGTYQMAFYSSAAISLAALVALFIAKNPHALGSEPVSQGNPDPSLANGGV
jgi:MFS transporter, OFA family, oxalate/formate antiporter